MQTQLRSPSRAIPAAVVSLAVLAAFVAGSVAASVPADSATAGAAKSHLGAAASEHVTLELSGPVSAREFHRVLPTGVREPQAYRVPVGSSLLVREVEIAAGFASANPPGRTFRLRMTNDAIPAESWPVAYFGFASERFYTDATQLDVVDSWRSDQGVVVGAGCALTLDATATLDAATGDAVSIAFHGDAVVRGTLLRSK